jgi:hypothetical protein
VTREGESDWEPIKILLQRDELDCPKSQARVPTRTCQGHVVTTDLPTLGTSPNKLQRGSTTQEATHLGKTASLGRTARPPATDTLSRLADGPNLEDGWSVKMYKTSRRFTTTVDGPFRPHGWSDDGGLSETLARTVRQTSSNRTLPL